jgi:hypothetical protein
MYIYSYSSLCHNCIVGLFSDVNKKDIIYARTIRAINILL